MIYHVTNDFIKIHETSGTIQNPSSIHTLEISENNERNNGILIYPLQKHSFTDTEIFIRCIDGQAEVRVVPFILDAKGGGGNVESFIIAGESYHVATNTQIYDLLDNVFGKED